MSKFPIKNKQRVLEALNARLHISEVVLNHSRSSGEPASAQKYGLQACEDLREAMRFIEEHAE